MPRDQIHQYLVKEDDEEIFASLVSRVPEENDGYLAWHILNIVDGDDLKYTEPNHCAS